MSGPGLLPPNATTLERRIAASGADQLEAIAPSPIITALWNSATCPAELLHVLAWAESVDDWNPAWSEDRKRAVIAESRAVHRLKGTPAAIKRALAVRGQPDATILERYDSWTRDGSSDHNGIRKHGGSLNWAVYKVILNRPITQDQATDLLTTIAQVTRNCCRLVGFDFTQAALRHDGTARRDGSYTRGLINT